jgi:V8-like Glu-specific endopeptidase
VNKSFIIKTINDTFSNIDNIKERLHSHPYLSKILNSETADSTPVTGIEDFASETKNFTATNLRSVIDFGVRGLDKIKNKKNKNITSKELRGLAAIVMLEARPAISITNDKFSEPPAEWKILNNHRKRIQSNLLSVGYIAVNGAHKGTGFLVSEDIIITNKHVVRKYITKKNGNWVFRLNSNASIDYGQDLDSNNHNLYNIDEVINMHPNRNLDLALLKVKSDNNANSPKPLKISKNIDVNKSKNRKIYVVGYPQKDPEHNDTLEMDRIFEKIYGFKRLQPGMIRGLTNLDLVEYKNICLLHDCSTLGGNSGSCIIDLETNKVIGLHFDGEYLEINKAIGLWNLVDDPLMKNAGINFS